MGKLVTKTAEYFCQISIESIMVRVYNLKGTIFLVVCTTLLS